jgi:hypothetical protein
MATLKAGPSALLALAFCAFASVRQNTGCAEFSGGLAREYSTLSELSFTQQTTAAQPNDPPPFR